MTEIDAKRHAEHGHLVGSKIADERYLFGREAWRNPRREQHFGERFHGAVLNAHGDRDLARAHLVGRGHRQFASQRNVFG